MIFFLFPLVTSACAHRIINTDIIDRGHSLLGRRIADMVDRVDQTIGDPRVEDRQVKVKLSTGAASTFLEGGSVENRFRVSGRTPLPALERKAHLFFDVGGDAESVTELSDPIVEDVEKSYQARLQYLSLREWPFSFGINMGAKWKDGMIGTIKPFLRWEKKLDPYRLYLSQEVYYQTDEVLGEQSHVHVDYIFRGFGFLRFITEATLENETDGMNFKNAFLFRQPAWKNGALSYELGLVYNNSELREAESYAQIQWITKVWRPWLELEIKPRAVYKVTGSEDIEYSFLLGLNVIFEGFLRNDYPQDEAVSVE